MIKKVNIIYKLKSESTKHQTCLSTGASADQTPDLPIWTVFKNKLK